MKAAGTATLRLFGRWRACLVLFFLVIPWECSAFDLSAVGAIGSCDANYEDVNAGSNAGVDSRIVFGFGILADFPIMPTLGLQAGALYLPRKFAIETLVGGFTLENELSYADLQFPFLLKTMLVGPLSFGIGAYLSEGLGQVHSESSYNGAVSRSDSDFASAGIEKLDYGGLVAAGVKVPLFSTVSGVADVRFAYGLRNLETDPNKELRTRELQVLAGVSQSF